MREICHLIVKGPLITAGATAWGGHLGEHAELKERITQGCQEVRKAAAQGLRLSVKICFRLFGARLKMSDLDNMAKVVLDSAFESGAIADRSKDRFVWRLELEKVRAIDAASEETEMWFWAIDDGGDGNA